jgi:hypothetical protein
MHAVKSTAKQNKRMLRQQDMPSAGWSDDLVPSNDEVPYSAHKSVLAHTYSSCKPGGKQACKRLEAVAQRFEF